MSDVANKESTMEKSSMVFIALLNYSNKTAKSSKFKQFEVLVTTSNPVDEDGQHSNKESLLVLPSLEYQTITSEQALQVAINNKIFEVTTKGKTPGIKVKRIVFAGSKQINSKGAVVKISLYVIPLLVSFDTEAPSRSKLINLPALSSHIDSNSDLYGKEINQAIKMLQQWVKQKQSKPLIMQTLFKAPPLNRIKGNITNSAYSSEANRDWVLLQNKLRPEEAMDKLKKINQADLVIYNPLFGSESERQGSINCIVKNSFFGGKIPDYTKVVVPTREEWYKGQEKNSDFYELSWEEEFPLHRAAAYGDTSALHDILTADLSCIESWDHDGWAPIHYACWYGHVTSVKILLEVGCNPNLCNRNRTSLLHLAAGCGHHQVLKILSEHPLIDRHVIDGRDRTVLECCEQIRSKDWQKCVLVLKELNHRPLPKLVIHKMDGSEKVLEVRNGSNTKVNDIIAALNLADAQQYFSLWITSKSLHLQLKGDHSPLVEIENWMNALYQLSGLPWAQCLTEPPRLVLKRDVKLMPLVEENVTNIFAIRLLYEEAHAQVLRGLYTCTDQVIIAMAAISIRMYFGPYNIKKPKTTFFDDEVLRQVLPMCKLLNRSVNWPQRLLTEYREISQHGPGEISQLQLLYLRYCWTQIPTYGCAFFTGYAYATRQTGEERIQKVVPLYIGINYRGIHFVKVENKSLLVSVNYLQLTWQLREEEDVFQIRTTDHKINMIIHTPQAAFVCGLMTKLKKNLNLP